METCCLRFKKNTANRNSSVQRTKQNGIALLSNCNTRSNKNQGLLKIKK